LTLRWPGGYTDAGVAAEVICEYLDAEQAALEDTYRLGVAKLRGLSRAWKTRADGGPARRAASLDQHWAHRSNRPADRSVTAHSIIRLCARLA
jgi:hypothetical protein